MKRTLIILAALGGVLALWFTMYQLAAAFNPSPLGPQPNLRGTSEVPTSTPVVVRLNYDDLVEQVIPVTGTTIAVEWGDLGQGLIEAGAIDLEKFETQYGGLSAEQREILQGDNLQQITFTPDNIQFWTNVLWSLGLTQQSKVLSAGPMMKNSEQTPLGNYASTG
ncbi:MAG: hypothetical protein HY866_01800, partial [Chloroflexi bacterium]|nr:hypothetical protein [Chloroflexota bacterium]